MKDYKTILKGVVNIINTTEKSDIGFANICSYIGENCPELKESEDERIRKGIIDFLWKEKIFLQEAHSSVENNPKYRFVMDAIAWLEKQGEQKPKDKYTFKSIPRLLEMVKPTDRAKAYCQKLVDSLLQEGYATDAKIVSNCLKQMNGEKVADIQSIEKRAHEVFPDDDDENTPLYRQAFIAGAEWQKEKDKSVTKDLGDYINELSKQFPEVSFAKLSRIAVRVAKWKERQLMANAVEGVVHHFEKCKVASVHYNDPTGVPMAYFTSPEGLSAGDKVKIIVIKED